MESANYIRLLADGLSSGKLLPPGIQAKIVAVEPQYTVADRRFSPDLIVEFTAEDSSPKSVQAVIEFKSQLSPMTLEGVVHQVVRFRNELRSQQKFDDLYPMVAAPYISESVQNRCKELGVGYIDLNGTFGLIRGGLHIDIVRPATAFKSPQGIKNVFTGRSRRIVRALLVNPHQPFRLEHLASETDVSVGQVFHVLKRLEQDGLLERTTEGRALTKPRKLLQVFASEFKSDYAAKRKVFYGFSELPPQEFAASLRDYCQHHNIPCAFTLSSGLEPYERNTRDEVTAAYVSGPSAEIAAQLKVQAVGRGANVILMTPPDTDNNDAGGVFYKTRHLTNGLTGVNPIQLYLDFSLYGGRGEEQADFLVEHSLGFRT